MNMDDTAKIELPQPDERPASDLLRLPKSTYTGIVLGMALLVAINFLWFSGNLGFAGVNPHPFWLLVLPMAARYGFKGGMVSGVAAGLTLLALTKLGHPKASFHFFDSESLTLPVLFVTAGILLGEIRETQKKTPSGPGRSI